jgi:hypothetical protein
MEQLDNSFDDIRPLLDSEVEPAINELLSDRSFMSVIKNMGHPYAWGNILEEAKGCKTKRDFQSKVIYPVVNMVLDNKITDLNGAGIDSISKNDTHLYISNHRDIVLDAALLNILLFSEGLDTTEIAIGDNLLIYPWIEKVVRLNKSFIVKRGVSVRQKLEASQQLSDYIHDTIVRRKQSVWMAQREGRAKDSDDKTQTSLLKMLTLHDRKNPIETLKLLNIRPLSISYEYDPCDFLKAKEFQLKRDNPEYIKSKSDDIENMLNGIMGFKGGVNFKLGNPVNKFIDDIPADTPRTELLQKVADIIDREIYVNYKFFSINYVAYDMMTGNNSFSNNYTKEDVHNFEDYLNRQLSNIHIENKDDAFLKEQMIKMYGNTVKNYMAVTGE